MLWSVGVRAVAAAAMLAVVGYHLSRLGHGRGRLRAEVALDLTHLAMAAAMLAMITGWLDDRASAWCALAFAGPAVWLVARAVHAYVIDGAAGVLAAKALGCCGMVGMLALSAGAPSSMAGSMSGSMSGMTTSAGSPVPAVLLLVPMVALTTWTAAGLRGRAGRDVLAGGCQVLMAGTTALMAVALL